MTTLPAPDATPPALYAARRFALMTQLRAAGVGAAVLWAGPETLRNGDVRHPYRFDSAFHYLTGFAEPNAMLMLLVDPNGPDRTIFFCRARVPEKEMWEGARIGPHEARTQLGFDEAYDIEQSAEMVRELGEGRKVFWFWPAARACLDASIERTLAALRAVSTTQEDSADPRTLLDEARLVKDAHEQSLMRTAARISAQAQVRAMRACTPGLREYELEAELLHEFRRHGAQGPAYGSIVAAGANACVLHHPAGRSVLRHGELCLIDAACEFEGYAADITRTFPVDGRFSAAQRVLYEWVLAAQEAAIAAVRPGLPCDGPHKAAVRVLAAGMLDTGLLDTDKVGNLDDVIANGSYRRFYMHKTSHWIGRDVHDVGGYGVLGPDGKAAVPATARPLQTGMALTLEPGLYVRPAPDVPQAYWNIGIRIEDDAFVTDTGCELISRDVPVSVKDIEALMRK